MVVVDSRTADELIPIIQEWVEVGSEIHTDSWASYNGLSSHGYIHKLVNHSDPEHRFIAEDGTHTQRIEATWRPAKNWFRGLHIPEDQFADRLCEYLWRRKKNIDVFENLISAIKGQYKF
nr:unnamed protein product [Callosobruchus analis]